MCSIMAFLQIACALLLFAFPITADVVPANGTSGVDARGTIQLQTQNGQNITRLVPITREAGQDSGSVKGNLYYSTPDNIGNISAADIAYISCNPSDYNGNIDATRVFQTAYDKTSTIAVILYSTASDYCDYTNISTSLQDFRVFSMTNKEDSQTVLNKTNDMDVSMKFLISITRSGTSNGGFSSPQNPLGPSPSTAVAMIILYSITGIITTLFLTIIITGAIRAHRHPEQYGPRDILGRPRQSRARGLGRAILDTLPIVKFGQPESPKPTDVELASTTEARDETNQNATPGDHINQAETEVRSVEHAEAHQNAAEEQQSGIAPALSIAAAAEVAHDGSAGEGLGCSICTDDFEQGQDIRVLPCNHKFHPECVDPWLLNVSGTCPLCRVDLRPDDTPNSTNSQDPNTLAPPLHPETTMSHRRRSAFRDILLLRSHPNASTEERISALRRLREQHRNASGDVATGSANDSTDDVTAARRSRRISTRFSSVFGGRTRGHGQDDPQPQPQSAVSTEASVNPTPHAPVAQNATPTFSNHET